MSRNESGTTGAGRRAVDWEEIHRRIETAGAAIERLWQPESEEARRILKGRARALAREPLATEAIGESLEVVEFSVGYERYAVESRYVREVAPLESLTSVPCTPAFVCGVTNLRGEMISIIDIKKFFGLPEQGLADRNQLVVLARRKMIFALLTDSILGMRRLPRSEIALSLATLTGIRADYLYGVTPERVTVLDAAKLLEDEQIVVHEQVAG